MQCRLIAKSQCAGSFPFPSLLSASFASFIPVLPRHHDFRLYLVNYARHAQKKKKIEETGIVVSSSNTPYFHMHISYERLTLPIISLPPRAPPLSFNAPPSKAWDLILSFMGSVPEIFYLRGPKWVLSETQLIRTA